MSARRALMLVVAVGIGPFVVRPALAGPWSLQPGEYATDVSGSWSSTYHYTDENGDDHRFPGGGRLERRTAMWQTELGWKKHTSFVLGIPFVSVTRLEGAGMPLPTTTVLGDAVVGFKRSLANGRTAAALEVDAILPMGYQGGLDLAHAGSTQVIRPDGSLDYNLARAVSTPRAGDGQASVAGTLQLGAGLGHLGFVSGYGGYCYRGTDWQGQVLSGADLAFWFARSWLVGGRYRGVNAGTGDDPTRDTSVMTAGPVITYRVDDRIDVVASSSHVFWSRNAPHSDEIRFGFTFKQTRLNRVQGYLGSTQRP